MKIWLDFCEPKSVIMLRPLYNRLIKEHNVFITARDFDATYALLDEWGVPYIKVGKHGGASLSSKLHAYVDRLDELLSIVELKKPDFLFCITSPEAIRISFGLGIPHIMFYDEPRSVGCSKLTLSMVEHLIVPKPIPYEWYGHYGISEDKVIRFNGIDEVGWLNQEDFHPNVEYCKNLDLIPEKYLVFRTIATQSYAHLERRMKPHETLLTEIIPDLEKKLKSSNKNFQYLVIPRYDEQYEYLKKHFSDLIKTKKIILKRSVAHLADVMYYSAAVISGGGTMVRESALLGVPSIEFIGSETYPQEQFLMEHGFPLVHKKSPREVVEAILDAISKGKESTWDKIDNLDNPIKMGLNLFDKLTKS